MGTIQGSKDPNNSYLGPWTLRDCNHPQIQRPLRTPKTKSSFETFYLGKLIVSSYETFYPSKRIAIHLILGGGVYHRKGLQD